MNLPRTTAFALLYVFGAQVSAAADKPNILVILADDLGYGDGRTRGQSSFLDCQSRKDD